MILVSPNKNKIYFLYLLVALFFGFIVYQWFSHRSTWSRPLSSDQSNTTWSEIGTRLNDSFGEIKDNFSEVKDQLSIMREEFNQQSKQEEILNIVNSYISNKNNTSTEINKP